MTRRLSKPRVLIAWHSYRLVWLYGNAVIESQDGRDAMHAKRWKAVPIEELQHSVKLVFQDFGRALLARQRRARRARESR